ncbi:MAG: methyltransferase type 12 [Verrucomicrobia bacterium]|nr:methyltransferase type 12 [Verrucomicrobiota bacterium]MCF7707980.1 methyltransferase type 12 [Verrucomicrobiota bacterium]
MSKTKSIHSKDDERFLFFKEFLKHPLKVGSFIPSSRFLERRILSEAKVDSANTIIELGAGTGGTTRAILRTMPQNARLLCVEINPQFQPLLKSIKDQRLIAHLGDATDLKNIILHYEFPLPDVIICGIPFSTMSYELGKQILDTVYSTLAPNGHFVAYQVSKRIISLCRPIMGQERSHFEIFNIPPMHVYRWNKNSSS